MGRRSCDGDWGCTCGEWDGGGQCGDRSANDDLWNGLRSSTGGDDGFGGDGDGCCTCGTWDGCGQCGDWSGHNDLWNSDRSSTG
ncbi:unnamed protein product [[Candida] boidinii]|uniref:Unnamed protein product n=1 Tax=Candida boidinii TaxID=5477 RepID=A0A9W6T8P1_CANBO|nr:unnamed protein product [[Candida] boidinii]GMG18707.1 unnamed protein product [[Candida] boidinii]